MAAAADDDHIVGRFRRGIAPSRIPMAVSGQRLSREIEN
jgi:hypothetical protein